MLDDCQHDEMCKIRDAIDKNTTHLEELYQQASSDKVEQSLKEMWQISNEFS